LGGSEVRQADMQTTAMNQPRMRDEPASLTIWGSIRLKLGVIAFRLGRRPS